MPKGHRPSRSQGYYRLSPTTPTSASQQQYQPLPLNTRTTALPNTYYPSPVDNMSQHPQSYTNQSSNSYANGGPVQHPSSIPSSYSIQPQIPSLSNSAPLSSLRPSSGAWTPTDDATLMQARAQGMNWSPIQQTYFPSKTPNACRKRHERLMERRGQDDWDAVKLEHLANRYMDMRKDLWQPLADAVGEKWLVVEQKCMAQGLKNLQTQSRSYIRRERIIESSNQSQQSQNYSSHSQHPSLSSIQSQNPNPGHYSTSSHNTNNGNTYVSSSHAVSSDDSGISGLSYHTPTPSTSDQDHLEYENMHPSNSHDAESDRSVYGYHHSHSSSGGSGGSRGSGMGGWVMSGAGGMGNRIPSMDMGIEAIINRPNQGR